ncbi:MAG: flagellar M-ring protein FliF [Planctomycetes bacterium GWF2_41_51]|nr:MAG: flagellar M-ring protein FliF [Planctomycetes bacterium GWF2_41_51]HBG26623.1 flagellar M-ring protein FliF [Phycisphaerales bacterium]
MDFIQKLKLVWQNVSFVHRILLIAIALTFVIVGTFLTHWARRPDMALLYSGLEAEEASKIVEKVAEKNIVYKLASGGTTIYVPKEYVAQLRLDMAKEGLPEGGQKGYGIFDNEKIGISPFVQNVNLNRALQEELAKSIQMIDGVVHARVHIVTPEKNLFNSASMKPSASVVLRLKAGYRMSGLNIAAITHLVAGSVEGLKSENITVVDSQGRLLSSETDKAMGGAGVGTMVDFRERVEQGLAGKVEDMLATVLGQGRATVKVSTELDMNSTSLITKSYDPTGVVVKEEITEKSKTPGSTIGADGTPAANGGKETDNTITTNKLFGEKTQTVSELPGGIKSLSVAAFVDLYPSDPNSKELIIPEASVVEIIKNALGLKDPNSIKVVNARFFRQPLAEIEEKKFDFAAIAGQASLGIMAICALVVLKMFSGAKKKTVKTSSAELPPADAAGLLPAGVTSDDPLVLRKQIADSLRNNPEQAKQLFSSWLEDKGS